MNPEQQNISLAAKSANSNKSLLAYIYRSQQYVPGFRLPSDVMLIRWAIENNKLDINEKNAAGYFIILEGFDFNASNTIVDLCDLPQLNIETANAILRTYLLYLNEKFKRHSELIRQWMRSVSFSFEKEVFNTFVKILSKKCFTPDSVDYDLFNQIMSFYLEASSHKLFFSYELYNVLSKKLGKQYQRKKTEAITSLHQQLKTAINEGKNDSFHSVRLVLDAYPHYFFTDFKMQDEHLIVYVLGLDLPHEQQRNLISAVLKRNAIGHSHNKEIMQQTFLAYLKQSVNGAFHHKHDKQSFFVWMLDLLVTYDWVAPSAEVNEDWLLECALALNEALYRHNPLSNRHTLMDCLTRKGRYWYGNMSQIFQRLRDRVNIKLDGSLMPYAIQENDSSIARRAIQRYKEPINHEDFNQSPLWRAVATGAFDVVFLLLAEDGIKFDGHQIIQHVATKCAKSKGYKKRIDLVRILEKLLGIYFNIRSSLQLCEAWANRPDCIAILTSASEVLDNLYDNNRELINKPVIFKDYENGVGVDKQLYPLAIALRFKPSMVPDLLQREGVNPHLSSEGQFIVHSAQTLEDLHCIVTSNAFRNSPKPVLPGFDCSGVIFISSLPGIDNLQKLSETIFCLRNLGYLVAYNSLSAANSSLSSELTGKDWQALENRPDCIAILTGDSVWLDKLYSSKPCLMNTPIEVEVSEGDTSTRKTLHPLAIALRFKSSMVPYLLQREGIDPHLSTSNGQPIVHAAQTFEDLYCIVMSNAFKAGACKPVSGLKIISLDKLSDTGNLPQLREVIASLQAKDYLVTNSGLSATDVSRSCSTICPPSPTIRNRQLQQLVCYWIDNCYYEQPRQWQFFSYFFQDKNTPYDQLCSCQTIKDKMLLLVARAKNRLPKQGASFGVIRAILNICTTETNGVPCGLSESAIKELRIVFTAVIQPELKNLGLDVTQPKQLTV